MDPVYEGDWPRLLAKDLCTYFDGFYHFYHDWLFRVCCHLIGNPDDAEQLTRNTFTAVFLAMQKKEAEEIEKMKLKGYLAMAAARQKINITRENSRRALLVPLESPEGAAWVEDILDEAFFPQPEIALERKESDQRIYDLLMSLPQKYRVVIWLRHIEGISIAEIGRILGISWYRASNLLDDAMALLKQAVSDPEHPESSCIE